MEDELEELKRLRKEAIEKEEDSFIYNGKPVLVSYAKYLISYIESEL